MASNEKDAYLVDCKCNWIHCNKRVSVSTMYRHRLKYTLERDYPPRQAPRPMPVEETFNFDDPPADCNAPPLPPPPTNLCEDAVPSWNDPVFPLNGNKPPDIILGELILIYFEWMSANKVSNACAEGAATMMRQLMPTDANGIEWQGAQRLLNAIYNHSVVSVDICPNDCISYYDCKHPKMAHYKHAHRTWCPHCGADRKLTHKDGTIRSAKKGYYLPCGTWLHDLFRIPDLAKELNSDTASPRPPGHASASRGWKQKVPQLHHQHSFTTHQNIIMCIQNECI